MLLLCKQGHVLFEEHQLFEVGTGTLRPEDVIGYGQHPLHGRGAREGDVVLYELVYPHLPVLLWEEGP